VYPSYVATLLEWPKSQGRQRSPLRQTIQMG
jgi:hypothetical protein